MRLINEFCQICKIEFKENSIVSSTKYTFVVSQCQLAPDIQNLNKSITFHNNGSLDVKYVCAEPDHMMLPVVQFELSLPCDCTTDWSSAEFSYLNDIQCKGKV